MSDLNCEWLVENFGGQRSVIFDIGAADLSDSIRFKRFLPDSIIYSFEPSPIHQTNNLALAKEYEINYFELAMSDYSGVAKFHPGNQDAESGLYIGTLLDKTNDKSGSWLASVEVNVKTYNEFCDQYHVSPDFIHIDVEGVEHLVLANMNKHNLPKAIWAETQHTFLSDVMLHQDFIPVFEDKFDTLYIRKDVKFTQYQSFSFEHYDHNAGKITPLDFSTRIAEWLASYKNIKDPSWPDLNSMEDFEKLPDAIKKECREVFGFDIDKSLLK